MTVSTEEDFCKYMKSFHCGSENIVTSKQLEKSFGLKGVEIRNIVNSLRCKGFPICSNLSGYFYASEQRDIDSTVAQLNSRIGKISKARNGLLEAVL